MKKNLQETENIQKNKHTRDQIQSYIYKNKRIGQEEEFRSHGYTGAFKNCIKCGARPSKTEEYYKCNPKNHKSQPSCNISIACGIDRSAEQELSNKDNHKERSCAVFFL